MEKTNSFSSYNIRVNVPTTSGTTIPMFVVIVEDKLGQPFKLDIFSGKCGTEYSAWLRAAGDLIELLWALKDSNGNQVISMGMIIQKLSNIYTQNYATQTKGAKVYSGPQGIEYALTQYLQMKREEDSYAVAV